MAKKKATSWTVTRQYQHQCTIKECLRMIIRRHLQNQHNSQ
ncbi:MAG: hypothetical protein Q4D32_07240 [Eubacteriales bacterium]|nr:hypothetical protein [Eubacteriales bacterium]